MLNIKSPNGNMISKIERQGASPASADILTEMFILISSTNLTPMPSMAIPPGISISDIPEIIIRIIVYSPIWWIIVIFLLLAMIFILYIIYKYYKLHKFHKK